MIDFDIGQLAPRFLMDDRNGRAMARAMEAGMMAALEVVRRGVELVIDVQSMPEWRLDELAWELNTPWYIHDAGIDAKRSAILRGENVNRRLGTPWAVETVAGMYFGASEVQEWHDYDGEPFHFQVLTGNLNAATLHSVVFRELVERTKNARSVFDGVIVNPRTPTLEMWAGMLGRAVWRVKIPQMEVFE